MVNSGFMSSMLFVDPGERIFYSTSYGRKDDSGGGDLYIATKDANGKWKPAENLKEVNSKQLELLPICFFRW